MIILQLLVMAVICTTIGVHALRASLERSPEAPFITLMFLLASIPFATIVVVFLVTGGPN